MPASFFDQLKLFLWKNATLKRRAGKSGVIEFLVPIFVALILVLIRGVVKEDHDQRDLHVNMTQTADGQVAQLIFQMACGRANFGKSEPGTSAPNNMFGWSPSSDPRAREAMQYVVSQFTEQAKKEKLIWPSFQCFDPPKKINTSDFLSDLLMEFKSEADLEVYVGLKSYGMEKRPLFGAIVFQPDDPKLPNTINYKLRFNWTDTPFTTLHVNKLMIGFDETKWMEYIWSGFVVIQYYVNQFLMKSFDLMVDSVKFQPFPIGKTRKDPFVDYLGDIAGLFLLMGFVWPFTRMVRLIVDERERRIEQGMLMMGLQPKVIEVGWGITYFVIMGVPALVITALGRVSFFRYSDFSIMLIFFLLLALSLVAIALALVPFFSRSKNAAFFSFFAVFVMYLPFMAASDKRSISVNSGLSVFPPVAFSLGVRHALQFEQAFEGIRYDNLFQQENSYTFGTALIFLSLDTGVFLMLAWYLSRVIPREFGSALPWYFPFTREFWCASESEEAIDPKKPLLGMRRRRSAYTQLEEKDAEEGHEEAAMVEEVPPELQELCDIEVKELTKAFGGGVAHALGLGGEEESLAVDRLNLEIYRGQIFALLGHNGAGKTTTINMLTGLLPPTRGTAFVNDFDIIQDMNKIRSVLGVCPQHDFLWPSLSPKDHLYFYAILKGVDPTEALRAVDRSVSEVGLNDAVLQRSQTLSGGQRRRLSLAVALIGDPRVVFLDEPTSGVDPQSRRAIWDLIRAKRKNRSIVLTTHFMDEADALGDRIAILHKGKLKCAGSPLFLKNAFGVGYTLTLSLMDTLEGDEEMGEEVKEAIHRVVTRNVPSASSLSAVSREVSYRLPLKASESFPTLLRELDAGQQELGIQAYGLSVTTMEEVFLRVADEGANLNERSEDLRAMRTLSSLEDAPPSFDYVVEPSSASEDEEEKQRHSHMILKKRFGALNASEPATATEQIRALLKKRWQFQKRDRKAWMCQFVVPFLLLIVGLQLLHIPLDWSMPALEMDPAIALDKVTPMPYNAFPPVQGSNVRMINSIITEGPHVEALPLPLNGSTQIAFATTLLDTEAGGEEVRYGALLSENMNTDALNWVVLSNVSGLHALPSFFALSCSALIRNITSDLSAGIVTTNHPLPITALEKDTINMVNGIFSAIVISLALCFIPASFGVFVVKEREIGATHLQRVSGLSSVAYWSANYIWDLCNYLLAAIPASFIVLAYNNPNLTGENFPVTFISLILFGFAVIPFTYCLSFLFKKHAGAQNFLVMVYLVGGVFLMILFSALFMIPSTRHITNVLFRWLFRLSPNFCMADTIFLLSLRNLPQMKMDKWDWSVCGYDFMFLGFEAVIYFALALFIEWGSNRKWLVRLLKPETVVRTHAEARAVGEGPPGGPDEDVLRERELIESQNVEEACITLHGLRKTFPGRRVAVDDLYFRVSAGECFGFLGVNGAGKTTTLRMLTGDEFPTSGTATVVGLDVQSDAETVRRLIGYCPQFDALHEHLTPTEALSLYGRIRGVTEADLPAMVSFLLDKMQLGQYADRPAGKLSGGNKRKLSVGVALIGNPPVVFLDEPSTGMDPVARRSLWKFLSDTMRERAVILTTHSMEEGEALCNRIGILANGELVCLGSAQHLKTKYGRGLSLEVNTGTKSPHRAREWVFNTFEGAEELECYGGALRMHISQQDRSLADVFSLIEAAKDSLDVQHYSVGQTTLEQIFVYFARRAQQNVAAGVLEAEEVDEVEVAPEGIINSEVVEEE